MTYFRYNFCVFFFFVTNSLLHAASFNVPLDWKSVKKAKKYNIQIAKGNKRNIIISENIKKSRYTFKAKKPGIYFWRVRARVKNKWKKFSKFKTLDLKDSVAKINRPIMQSPKDSSSLVGPKVIFKWQKLKGNSVYHFELFDLNKPDKPLYTKKTKKNKISYKFKQKEGSFQWRVTAKGQFGTRSKSQKFYTLSLEDKNMKKYAHKLDSVVGLLGFKSINSITKIKSGEINNRSEFSDAISGVSYGAAADAHIFKRPMQFSFEEIRGGKSSFETSIRELNIKTFFGKKENFTLGFYFQFARLDYDILAVDYEVYLPLVGYNWKKSFEKFDMKLDLELISNLSDSLIYNPKIQVLRKLKKNHLASIAVSYQWQNVRYHEESKSLDMETTNKISSLVGGYSYSF